MNKEKNEDNCIGNYCGVSVCLPEEDYEYYKGTLHEQIDELYLENEQLKERIDKAIEYIKAVGVRPKEIDSFILLNILKGENNE